MRNQKQKELIAIGKLKKLEGAINGLTNQIEILSNKKKGTEKKLKATIKEERRQKTLRKTCSEKSKNRAKAIKVLEQKNKELTNEIKRINRQLNNNINLLDKTEMRLKSNKSSDELKSVYRRLVKSVNKNSVLNKRAARYKQELKQARSEIQSDKLMCKNTIKTLILVAVLLSALLLTNILNML